MKNIRLFLSGNFQFLVVKFSIHMNRCVFVMFLQNVLVVVSRNMRVFRKNNGPYIRRSPVGVAIFLIEGFLISFHFIDIPAFNANILFSIQTPCFTAFHFCKCLI